MRYTDIMSNQEVKSEAVKIMRRMGVLAPFIENYQVNDVIPQFKCGIAVISKQWTDEGLNKYHMKYKPYAITTDTVYGMKMMNFLYLSPYREDLEHMCRQLNDGMFAVYAYCYNVDRPELSESGSILIKITNGNIQRVG